MATEPCKWHVFLLVLLAQREEETVWPPHSFWVQSMNSIVRHVINFVAKFVASDTLRPVNSITVCLHMGAYAFRTVKSLLITYAHGQCCCSLWVTRGRGLSRQSTPGAAAFDYVFIPRGIQRIFEGCCSPRGTHAVSRQGIFSPPIYELKGVSRMPRATGSNIVNLKIKGPRYRLHSKSTSDEGVGDEPGLFTASNTGYIATLQVTRASVMMPGLFTASGGETFPLFASAAREHSLS